jgi:hypothetical protein
MGLTFS